MATPVSMDDRGKDKKPKDTQFKQQKLPAWQPIMTAGTVLPAFFALGIAFIPLGVALLLTSNSVQEVFKDYTHECDIDLSRHPSATSNMTCVEWLRDNNGTTCYCSITLQLETDFKGQVYMYYGLTNYYQNHRRYVKSRDDDQLKGKIMTVNTITDDCKPYNVEGDKVVAPCGAIANSLFNDTFVLKYNGEQGTDTPLEVGLNANGIAWQTDVDSKFANPENWDNTVHPPNWDKDVANLTDPNDPTNAAKSGYKNEDLIVWMRTAALPTFRKLYRLVKMDGNDQFTEGLPKGNYTVEIEYNYPVDAFEGRKRVILTTTSWMGGKNPFLGIAYLVVGSICIVLGIVFLIIHIRVGKNAMGTASERTPLVRHVHC